MFENMMHIQILIIAPIRFLQIKTDFNFKGFHFTNQPESILSKYDVAKMQKTVGILHYMDIQTSDCVIYQKVMHVIDRKDFLANMAHFIECLNGFADLFSNSLSNLLDSLWLIKDHKASVPLTHVICDIGSNSDYFLSSYGINNNWRTNNICSNESVLFSYDDIKEMDSTFVSLNNILIRSQKGNIKPTIEIDNTLFPGRLSSLNYNTFPRIIRSLFFLETARSQRSLPSKISLYMGALECLFTTDNETVTHKVSERTALFITETPEKRHNFYKEIKTAYKVRSKFMHGGDFNEKEMKKLNLSDISSKMDCLLRDIYIKILNDEELIRIFGQNSTEITNFFDHLLFGELKSESETLQ